jgi:hypothetical protein
LVAAALNNDAGLDPRSSQEPEKVASGEPTDLCDYMEKTAAELEEWAMSNLEGAEALEEKLEQDWESYQKDRMFKVALARTMAATIAQCSGNEAIRDANWDEVIKSASDRGNVDPSVVPEEEPEEPAPQATAKPKGKSSVWSSIAAIGIPVGAAGGGSNGSNHHI